MQLYVDNENISSIIKAVKVKSVIVLCAIAFCTLSPLSVHLTIAHGQTSLEAFDICHAGSLALSGSHDIPTISEPIYCPFLYLQNQAAEILKPSCKPFMTAFEEEHPPKI